MKIVFRVLPLSSTLAAMRSVGAGEATVKSQSLLFTADQGRSDIEAGTIRLIDADFQRGFCHCSSGSQGEVAVRTTDFSMMHPFGRVF
jgi:hypothetical protein